VALWRTHDILGTLYGSPNRGLLLKYLVEAGDELKHFYSKEAPLNRPQLTVTYTAGPQALPNETPAQRRVPSPDYYRIYASSRWRAVGIRMNNTDSNYDLRLYSDANYTSPTLARSNQGAGEVDFIVIDEQAPDDGRYPMTYSRRLTGNETGSYQIESVRRHDHLDSDGIDPADSFGPYPMFTTTVIRLYTFGETAGEETCISVSPISGDARLGVAVFAPGSAPDDYYFDRSEALASAVASGGGDSVSIDYTAPSGGTYGLVVWNEGSSSLTNFNIEGCASQADDANVFLPIILKDS
jgi:hypothetical protein